MLTVGDSIGPVHVTVRPEPMKVIAALQDDPNPIHWDASAAARAKLGDRVVNQGPATVSYLLRLAIAAAGDADAVLELRARFVANVFADDVVECTGTVVEVDTNSAVIDLIAAVDGRPVATGVTRISL